MAEPVANGVANGHAAEAEYEPQRILITGGAGFIASHVTRRLIKNYSKYKVRSCSNTAQGMALELVWSLGPTGGSDACFSPLPGRCAAGQWPALSAVPRVDKPFSLQTGLNFSLPPNRKPPPRPSLGRLPSSQASCTSCLIHHLCFLHVQVVVLDKLDYCATLNNLQEVSSSPQFKVSVEAVC